MIERSFQILEIICYLSLIYLEILPEPITSSQLMKVAQSFVSRSCDIPTLRYPSLERWSNSHSNIKKDVCFLRKSLFGLLH